MKKLISILLILSIGIAAHSQTITRDKSGNYHQVKDTSFTKSGKETGNTFTDTKGNVYPVMQSERGKLFIIRKSKNGNSYKMYLKTEGSK